MTETAVPEAVKTADRRARRRVETMTEILDLAEDVMSEEGVSGLSLAEGHTVGVQPPSLYKYFPSLTAVLRRAVRTRSTRQPRGDAGRVGARRAGLPALTAALEASGHFMLERPALGQLLFWRPVPSFEASDAAMAASHEMIELRPHDVA